ncbi:N-(5'-phosphoribosyl)anthranilate isomerase [Rhodovulum sp. 12E13]|uniref:N-(5'-phosphoribosyl)anthranilate isomerase n=1 Tax=Rhodovulum sp. 12E13 TaxID=2203891 RepID=UPI000E187294|nr:N-(5'-phosphoribosyl)anthranilate isomerase [Rhodovulum sp. 12E13]RDC73374.1 N-(5'-phosphoribosyl)anthranilate isomerase [Rhodovulum sp. 12E13]
MNMMPAPPVTSASQHWLEQIFSAKAAQTGGVVRRKVSDVERHLGRDRLELEVRRRGFHMVEVGGQFVILCNRGHMTVIC